MSIPTYVDAPASVPFIAPLLEVRGITKHFDGVQALRGVDLEVRPGEIHALLGENGAGKSTLIKIITGLYRQDQGEVLMAGEAVDFPNVRAAHRAGLVALYQELSIVPTISVAENIVLGAEVPAMLGVVRWKELRRHAQALLDRLGQHINLRRLAGGLSPVQQTMVAVARALSIDAKVLILDEPTAALTDTEIEGLFAVLRSLRDEGVAIVYISHRLEEVFALCDRLTVMRNGRTIVTKNVSDSSIDDVISTMVGREQNELYPQRGMGGGEVVLSVDGLSGRRVSDVSFQVRAGEVVGVGGLAGSGRSELLRLLAGAQKNSAGIVEVDGTAVVGRGVGRALDAGIALVPEERRAQGVILSAPIAENIALANLKSVSPGGIVSQRRIVQLAKRALADLRIKARSVRQPVGQLSGGNQQKVVLAKMLARNPKVLLMDEPTRGIDVGTKAEIYRLIRELAAKGTAVVAVSSELPELIGLSDRILVMHEGHISGEVDADGADDELILTYAYGRDA
ncbi:sugar ABC transporter ATP-binding protein [Microbacterium caowuchunii]|uniref:sugar ABC transporter ATP-binding protein n=1 Tax=Microbacterium caowuchunii TaxID=2614638 RepID=UPI00124884E3|nr:sugar ABC transporter ATP-binding protein [Microbacterium caowuchunii]QEW01134.1 sugar ABC transporter ATP-binding protein [Microbacterium caowuchunii]